MPTPPGYTIFESTAVLGVGTVLSPFADTTGLRNMFLECVIANSTGTTTFTFEGSFDGTTLDAARPYPPAVTAWSGAAEAESRGHHRLVQHRMVQATGATRARPYLSES